MNTPIHACDKNIHKLCNKIITQLAAFYQIEKRYIFISGCGKKWAALVNTKDQALYLPIEFHAQGIPLPWKSRLMMMRVTAKYLLV